MSTTCERCGRSFPREGRLAHEECDKRAVVYLAVEHGGYGCETGCCGHRVVAYDADDHEVMRGPFSFDHPFGEYHEVFAKEMAESFMPGGSRLLRLDESDVRDD